MPFKIVRNDITRVKADVIVNTANQNPICASGTDLAIYEAAGKEKLLAERANIGKIARGDIAVTGAYSLNAKYIIHTVGPVWTDGLHHEFEILEDCYRKSLQKALELKCESIAFPLISTGVYGFPKDKALQIAVSVFSQFLSLGNRLDNRRLIVCCHLFIMEKYKVTSWYHGTRIKIPTIYQLRTIEYINLEDGNFLI